MDKEMNAKTTKKHRFSVTLDDELYRQASELADRNKISVSWVVRYAVSNFFKEHGSMPGRQIPLPLSEFPDQHDTK